MYGLYFSTEDKFDASFVRVLPPVEVEKSAKINLIVPYLTKQQKLYKKVRSANTNKNSTDSFCAFSMKHNNMLAYGPILFLPTTR